MHENRGNATKNNSVDVNLGTNGPHSYKEGMGAVLKRMRFQPISQGLDVRKEEFLTRSSLLGSKKKSVEATRATGNMGMMRYKKKARMMTTERSKSEANMKKQTVMTIVASVGLLTTSS